MIAKTESGFEIERDAKGRVPVAAFGAAIGELIRSFSAGKNSASSPN